MFCLFANFTVESHMVLGLMWWRWVVEETDYVADTGQRWFSPPWLALMGRNFMVGVFKSIKSFMSIFK